MEKKIGKIRWQCSDKCVISLIQAFQNELRLKQRPSVIQGQGLVLFYFAGRTRTHRKLFSQFIQIPKFST